VSRTVIDLVVAAGPEADQTLVMTRNEFGTLTASSSDPQDMRH
jgi:hypothetical protein